MSSGKFLGISTSPWKVERTKFFSPSIAMMLGKYLCIGSTGISVLGVAAAMTSHFQDLPQSNVEQGRPPLGPIEEGKRRQSRCLHLAPSLLS